MIVGIMIAVILFVTLFIWDSFTYGKYANKPLEAKSILRGKDMSSPWLGTINNTGGTMIETSRKDPVTGHLLYINMFVIFGIPILPFGAYIATEGKRSGYAVYGEVVHYRRDFFHQIIQGWMWLLVLALVVYGISIVVENWSVMPWWAWCLLIVAALLAIVGLVLIAWRFQAKKESKRLRKAMWEQYERMEQQKRSEKPKCPIQEDGESDEAYTKRVNEYVKADTEWRKRNQPNTAK